MKNNEMGGACGTYGSSRGAYRVLVRRHEGKRSLGRPRCKWRKIFKLICKNWNGSMDWIDMAQDRNR
jgi:hypothetical protein